MQPLAEPPFEAGRLASNFDSHLWRGKHPRKVQPDQRPGACFDRL